ncbi:MAG: carboxypeptidase regulatory-like domain-containing protein [Bacteroidia bacterium]|nr:carboxypeptidase regulatory-like domain-containing protein [Bacteroidia bacterium]
MKTLMFFAAALWMFFSAAFAQVCPRIERSGDTLKAVPADAPSYRWFKNGNPIPDQNQNFILVDESAEYAVEVFGFSQSFVFGPVSADVSGRVFDPQLQPVDNATVRFAGQTQTTDVNGRFVFQNVQVLPGRNLVKIEKPGYFSAQTAVYVPAASPARKNVVVMLWPRENNVVFEAQDGVLVHESDFSISIPPAAVVRQDGSPYEGTAALYYRRLDPDYPFFGFGMPGGDFLALDAEGREVVLTSYGVLAVEMTDGYGNALRLRDGSRARVAMRIPSGMQVRPTAALWHFDENAGLWREEEALAVKGEFLVGEVSHFSWWNMDYFGPSGTVRGRIVDCGGNPVAFAPFCINQRCWTADENGEFVVIRVPADQTNTLSTAGQTVEFSLSEGDTADVGDISGGSDLMAAGLLSWDDGSQTTATLRVFTNGGAPPFEFSLDSLNWQSDDVFSGLTQTSYSVWIRESNGCVLRIETYLRRLGAGCLLFESESVDSLPKYTSWISALQAHNAGVPVFRYAGCDNWQLAVSTFLCLRELDLSGCGLTGLPEGLGQLLGLERLNLSNNPLDTIPSAVFSLANLRVLDMRWTDVPEGARSGYEAALEGVEIYWEACDVPGGWSWAKRAGGTGEDEARGVAAHADGSVTVTG